MAVHNLRVHGSAVGTALRVVATVLVGAYLVCAVPRAADISLFMLRLPARAAGESLTAARARLFGKEYTGAIEEIRRRVSAGEPYALVAGDGQESGGAYWVRYDLAPRRAVFLGRLERLRDAAGLGRALPVAVRQVVVAYAGRPPRLVERRRFLLEITLGGGGAAGPIGTDGRHAR